MPVTRPDFGAPTEQWDKYLQYLRHRDTKAKRRIAKVQGWLDAEHELARQISAEIDHVLATAPISDVRRTTWQEKRRTHRGTDSAAT